MGFAALGLCKVIMDMIVMILFIMVGESWEVYGSMMKASLAEPLAVYGVLRGSGLSEALEDVSRHSSRVRPKVYRK